MSPRSHHRGRYPGSLPCSMFSTTSATGGPQSLNEVHWIDIKIEHMDSSPTMAVKATSWWHHQMEIFSALLAICARNSPVPGEQRPVTRSFDVFVDLRLNKRLNKQSWGWWFELVYIWLRFPRECTWLCTTLFFWYLEIVRITFEAIATKCSYIRDSSVPEQFTHKGLSSGCLPLLNQF